MVDVRLTFALVFAHPAVLGWLAAAGVPLAIHLLSRRRYRATAWAAMEHLLAALEHARRRLRLQQWLLLAIRTLAIVLVVLAAAEPGLQPAAAPPTRTPPTYRLLVLDGSYSMAYQVEGRTRFQRAQELAARIVRESPDGDAFSLVLMGDPPRAVVAAPVFSRDDFVRELERLELPHASADLPKTLTCVEQVASAARSHLAASTRTEIYLLGDLGRVGWGLPSASPAAAAEFRARANRLARAARLTILDLGQADAENVAVTDLRVLDSRVAVGRTLNFEIEVANFGRRPRTGQAVEVYIDGRLHKRDAVDLPPGGRARLTMAYRFDAPGDHVVEARAEGDRLEVDNHRWLALPVRRQLRVLCVDGRPAPDPFRSATGYLAAALEAGGQEQAAPVRAEAIPESALAETALGDYDCVVLADVAELTGGEARMVEAYLRSGGGVVFFLGPRVLPAAYNRQLAGGHGPRVLPAALDAVVQSPQFRLDPRQFRHPILRPLQRKEQTGFTAPIGAYYRVKPAGGAPAEVALAAADGAPLILTAAALGGRSVLVTTSADPSWTAWPMWPTYVPLVHEIVNYAAGRRGEARCLSVGDVLRGSAAAALGQLPATIRLPSGQREPLGVRVDGDYGWWSYPETRPAAAKAGNHAPPAPSEKEAIRTGTTQSGIYAVQFAGAGQSELYAVNVNTAESDLAKLAPEELHKVWGDVPVTYSAQWQPRQAETEEEPPRRESLARWLLYAALALLLIEVWLARRFGHYQPQASP